MKTKIFFPVILLAVVCSAFISNAQERLVHGVVTTFDSIPLIDAQVKVISSKQTVLTDTLGRFSVSTNPKDKLKVSAAGFFNQTVKLYEKI